MIMERSFEKPVMLVDDDSDIVHVLGQALERDGFAVDAFSDPKEALASFERDRYSLVVTDIKMPALNGLELFSRISKIDPAAKIAFLTGYEIHDYEFKRAHPEIDNIAFVMQKPVSVHGFVRRVRQELQRTEADASGSDSFQGKIKGIERNAE